MVSLWWELCKLSIYTLKSDQWITIWCVKYELESLLLIFIYCNPKLKVACKNANFECQYIRIHTDEKASKISKIRHFAFSHKKYFVILTKLGSTHLNETIRYASKWFILTQNPESVNLKCITYPQPIPLPFRGISSSKQDSVIGKRRYHLALFEDFKMKCNKQ